MFKTATSLTFNELSCAWVEDASGDAYRIR